MAEKTCSACLTKHLPPYGRYCRVNPGIALHVGEERETILEDASEGARSLTPVREGEVCSYASHLSELEAEIQSERRIAEELSLTRKSAMLEAELQRLRADNARTRASLQQSPVTSASIGLQRTDDMQVNHLQQALSQLALTGGQTAELATDQPKGKFYRPETYIQHLDRGIPLKNVDFAALRHAELVHGMVRVVQHMYANNDPKLGSYIDHLTFLTGIAVDGAFVNEAYLKYDRYVADTVIKGADSFPVGDTVATSRFFNASNTYAQRTAESNMGKRGRRIWRNKSKLSEDDQSPSSPEGIDDICNDFNTRYCPGKCGKKHCCLICKGRHKSVNCFQK